MKDSADSSGAAAGFEVIEHTADVGLRAWGPTPEDLFTQAARGLISFLFDARQVRASRTRIVDIEASDLEEALVAWLQEILYLFEVKHFAAAEVDVQAAAAHGVRARVRGEPFDQRRHEMRMEIKAATYHGLDIRPTAAENGSERWECTIIFDT
jgi:SHS2 domain-containing protein